MSKNLLQTLETEVFMVDDDGDSLIQLHVHGVYIFASTKQSVKKMWFRYLKKVLESSDGSERWLEQRSIFEEKLKHRLFEKFNPAFL